MKHQSIIVTVALIFCALAVSIAAAQNGAPPAPPSDATRGPDVPQRTAAYLTFQGRITKPDGSPVSTQVQATFRIYTSTNPALAPNAIWISAVRTITPTNGLFTVYLGDGNDPDLDDNVAFSAGAIGIQIAPDPEMTPRQPLNTVVGYGDYTGVYGSSSYGVGVFGNSSSYEGVRGTSNTGQGVFGSSGSGTGVFGSSISSNGVSGVSSSSTGVFGSSISSNGVSGVSSSGTGVFGSSSSGYAGRFVGNVLLTGNLSKGGGSFKIDHPLDPANKYLYHSFVESPDMMNIYNGNITTAADGEAVITLPDWFEALNQDFRYQLTPIGQFAQAIVLKEIANHQFTIKTDKPNVKVSWQVTGIRHDPYANAYRIPVEENKPANERGLYLHPELYGKPESQGITTVQGQQAARATPSISETERQP